MPRFEKTDTLNYPAYQVSDVYANVYQTGASSGVALIDWKLEKGTFQRLAEGDLLQTVTVGEAVFVVGVVKENELLAKGFSKRPGL